MTRTRAFLTALALLFAAGLLGEVSRPSVAHAGGVRTAGGCTGDCTFSSVTVPSGNKLALDAPTNNNYIYISGGGFRFQTTQSIYAMNAQLEVFGNLRITSNSSTLVLPSTDTSGTPGAATANTGSGISAVAAAASSVVITDSVVSAASRVTANLRANDSTCTSVKSVIPAAGSFTVTLNAACTAATAFQWTVTN